MAQIGTIKVETAGGPVELPVYDLGDSGSDRVEAFRVQTASGPGFVPLTDVSAADRPYLRVQTGNGVKAFDTSASGIPDSEANQKLIHRWYFGETDPFVDQIGNADATNNGTTETTGQWVDGAARRGNGSDDYVNLTTLGSFGSSMANDFAVAFSFSSTDGDNTHMIGGYSDNNTYIQIAMGHVGANAGEIIALLQDANKNILWEATDNRFDDGNQHRVVVNKVSNTSGGLEIYVDQTDVPQRNLEDTGFSSPSDFDIPVLTHARNNRGVIDQYQSSDIDDPSIFGDSLTTTEIQSYDLPWQ